MPTLKHPPAPPSSPDDVEQQFYEALQAGDLERLMAVWSDDDDIVCVHPGGQRMVGPTAIRSAFASLFVGGVPVQVRPEQVQRLHTHACAVHSLLERVQGDLPDGGVETAWIVATNVYVLTVQGWRMVAHHTSLSTSRDVHDLAEASSVLH